jgi:DNA-directed RNA polymerase sigma subunit (sigma70/sigma32)
VEPSDDEVEALIKSHPQGMTLDEIAEVLGVTRQRTLQIVNAAIAKATRVLELKRINSADLSLD